MVEEISKEQAGAEPPEIDESAKTRTGDPVGGMPDWVRFPLVLVIVGAVSAASLSGMYLLTREAIERSKVHKVDCAFKSILGGRYANYSKEPGPAGHYVITDADDAVVAYAAQVKCPGSYNAGEPIELIVVLDTSLSLVLGARVVKSAETPGLGERVKEAPAAASIAGWVAGREPKRRVVSKKGGALVGKVEEKPDGSVVFTGPDGSPRTFSKDEVHVTEAPFPPAFLDQFTGVPLEKAKLTSEGGGVDAITGATVSSRAVTRGIEEAAKLLRAALGAERPSSSRLQNP